MSKQMTATQITASLSAELQLRMLVTIYAPSGGPFRFVANDNADLVFEGETYLSAEITRGEIKSSTEGDKEQVKLEMSNRWREWAAYVANHGNDLNGCRVVIQEVFLDCLDEGPVWLFEGVLNQIRMTVSNFEAIAERDTVDFLAEAPVMTYSPACQWRRFKDAKCGYVGAATSCDKTLATCQSLGNVLNFGGHPSIPKETVIRQ